MKVGFLFFQTKTLPRLPLEIFCTVFKIYTLLQILQGSSKWPGPISGLLVFGESKAHLFKKAGTYYLLYYWYPMICMIIISQVMKNPPRTQRDTSRANPPEGATTPGWQVGPAAVCHLGNVGHLGDVEHGQYRCLPGGGGGFFGQIRLGWWLILRISRYLHSLKLT